MAAVTIALLPILIFFVFAALLPVAIGVIVYRDAKSRGMEPVLWALVAALAPSLIGVIIYLIVRRSYAGISCAHCGHTLKEEFINCPYCGAALRYRRERRGAPVEAEWSVCAQCGTVLPQGRPPLTHQAPAASGTGKLLMVILIVVIALLLLLVLPGILFALFSYAA